MKYRISSFAATLVVLAALPVLAVAAQQPSTDLGDIDFPNSGAPEAQDHFLRGIAALHNFWFEEAADEFGLAQEADPEFALAYWGEAMSHNHPLWAEQDIAAARQVMRRLGATRTERMEKAPTEREKMYMEALEVLYGEGDKLERDIAYEKAMGRIHARFPEDREAATFHALSILGTVRRGDQGFFRQMRAGAIALDLFARYPNHPGAAHFVIHSFDDPEHAPLALPAAEKYAEIAPESSHALHMPSHIFVQHGMWDRVAQSNLAAFRASEKWVSKKNLSIAKKDWHAHEWRAYANAQRGVWNEISEAIDEVTAAAKETGDARLAWYRDIMEARYLLAMGKDDGRPLPEVSADEGGRYDARADMLLALGLGSGKAKNAERTEEAAKRVGKLAKMAEEKDNAYQANYVSIMMHELQGSAAMARGNTEEALKHLAKAAELEEKQDPPSGPAGPIKPSHELYGEFLVKAGKYDEAIEVLNTSLQRTPNRTASLLALARAAAKSGKMDLASETYGKLRTVLKDANESVPYLEEVRSFGAATDADAVAPPN
jgi:tetratricopeptide (TPR) repeat protein